jgi:hypothetical protein
MLLITLPVSWQQVSATLHVPDPVIESLFDDVSSSSGDPSGDAFFDEWAPKADDGDMVAPAPTPVIDEHTEAVVEPADADHRPETQPLVGDDSEHTDSLAAFSPETQARHIAVGDISDDDSQPPLDAMRSPTTSSEPDAPSLATLRFITTFHHWQHEEGS